MPSSPVRRSLAGRVERGFRGDIEGLRAVAVVAVVLFHAELLGVRGGFVGVDVFFVVSGYLITRLLLGEMERTGTVRLSAFWGRRARRLLPASVLVIVATLLVGRWALDPLSQRDLVVDALAANTFSANFVFAHRLGDYFGAQLGATLPSPLLHFWSLAVEEQFYLLWPPLLVLLTRRPRQYRRLVLAVTVGLMALGFLMALWWTSTRPSWAFYLLPARMGELLTGAILAVVGPTVIRLPSFARLVIGWAGVATIAVSCFVFDETTPWPGTAVLVPVLATMAVIVVGEQRAGARDTTTILGTAPMLWLGRHSYALYLWHWPVLVLADAKYGPLSAPQRIVLVGISVALSVLSYQLIENPFRHSRWLAAFPTRSLALGAVLIVLGLGVGWQVRASIGSLDGGVNAAAPELETITAETTPPTAVATVVEPTAVPGPAETSTTAAPAPATVAPAGLASAGGSRTDLVAAVQRVLADSVEPAAVPANLDPSLNAARNRSKPYDDGCVNIGRDPELHPCDYGVESSRMILLYGDSKAVQWFEPLEQIAEERGYQLVLLIKGGCPIADVAVPTPVLAQTCPPYRDGVIDWITRNQPDVVVVGNSYTQYTDPPDVWAEGVEATYARLAQAAPGPVIVLGDNPVSHVDPPACLARNLGDAAACATARDEAVTTDRVTSEAAAASRHGFTYVDTSDWFCTESACPAVVGNVLVYRDQTHITPPMATFLEPLIGAALLPVL